MWSMCEQHQSRRWCPILSLCPPSPLSLITRYHRLNNLPALRWQHDWITIVKAEKITSKMSNNSIAHLQSLSCIFTPTSQCRHRRSHLPSCPAKKKKTPKLFKKKREGKKRTQKNGLYKNVPKIKCLFICSLVPEFFFFILSSTMDLSYLNRIHTQVVPRAPKTLHTVSLIVVFSCLPGI